MSIASDLNQKVWDLMTREVITAREGVPGKMRRSCFASCIEKLVVVDAKGSCIGLITVKDEKARNHPMAAKDEAGRLLVAAATGAGDEGAPGRNADRCRSLMWWWSIRRMAILKGC